MQLQHMIQQLQLCAFQLKLNTESSCVQTTEEINVKNNCHRAMKYNNTKSLYVNVLRSFNK